MFLLSSNNFLDTHASNLIRFLLTFLQKAALTVYKDRGVVYCHTLVISLHWLLSPANSFWPYYLLKIIC